jgi:hypothetical protein
VPNLLVAVLRFRVVALCFLIMAFLEASLDCIKLETVRTPRYPFPILEQALRASTGLCGVIGMFSAVLSDNQQNVSEMSNLYKEYADCLPSLSPGKGDEC